jgi:hypothetical protein
VQSFWTQESTLDSDRTVTVEEAWDAALAAAEIGVAEPPGAQRERRDRFAVGAPRAAWAYGASSSGGSQPWCIFVPIPLPGLC